MQLWHLKTQSVKKMNVLHTSGVELMFVSSAQSKTFTLVCNPHETIARARAQMLHILFELGRAEHQFRFRFKGEYLRDGYTFEARQQSV